MSKALYNIKELFIDEGVQQIIIPEIQRDYVWKRTNVEKLLKSIVEDAQENASEAQQKLREQLPIVPPEVRVILERELRTNEVFSNIGFIYAYEDREFKNRYFLIDGQQRITTIYLLLLATAIKDDKTDYFSSNYFHNKQPKVDYKVREASHNFLINFISFLLEGGPVEAVKDQYWYYSIYNNDKTISSLLNNYEVIENYIREKDLSVDYIENNIRLWFFDINKSRQGEELYIYMNSRGEEVIANENIKAGLLESCSEEEKNIWGAEWEDWQDFFWKHRGNNVNADNGFNEFLRWIIIIEHILANPKSTVENISRFIQEIKKSDQFGSELLQLATIQQYFNALRYLSEKVKAFNSNWLTGKTNIIDYIRLFPLLMFLFKYEKTDMDEIESFELKEFKVYSKAFRELFTRPSDLLRRALLTKLDYSIEDGYSPKIGGTRYSFGSSVESWRSILDLSENRSSIIELLTDYNVRMNKTGAPSEVILNNIVEDYLKSDEDDADWILHFIQKPEIFAYCEEKKACRSGSGGLEEIFLMKRTKATSYILLTDLL